MQLPTHLIAGILIQFLINTIFPIPTWFSIILIMVSAFFSHFILDPLAKATYHPPERIHDNFWLIWHIFVYLIGFVIIGLFIWDYWLGMIFANLPDLWDWYTLRNIASRKKQPDWGKKYYLHPIATKIRKQFFSWLPDLTYQRVGIIPELSLIVLWFGMTIFSVLNYLS